jgi:hypothetical protein
VSEVLLPKVSDSKFVAWWIRCIDLDGGTQDL